MSCFGFIYLFTGCFPQFCYAPMDFVAKLILDYAEFCCKSKLNTFIAGIKNVFNVLLCPRIPEQQKYNQDSYLICRLL